MAPAVLEDDPVTAEYDIYLTPSTQNQQIYLISYPNRAADTPYNRRAEAAPSAVRIKPQSGHLEVDIGLNTEENFNKYQALKWGEAFRTGQDIQNDSATYGVAAGLQGAKTAAAKRTTVVKGDVDRDLDISNDLINFGAAEKKGKVLTTQTLGGQITRHDAPSESGEPVYFVGAFRGNELHLSKITGTVQLRPQFHHIDAEDQRNHFSSLSALESPSQPRQMNVTFRTNSMANPRTEIERREAELKNALTSAYEEPWTNMRFVDEDEQDAWDKFQNRLLADDETMEEKWVCREGDVEVSMGLPKRGAKRKVGEEESDYGG